MSVLNSCDKTPCEQKFTSICSTLQISLEEIRDRLNLMGTNMELLTKTCNTPPVVRKRRVNGNVEKSNAKKPKATNKSVEKDSEFNLDFYYQDLQIILSSIFQPPLDMCVLSYFTNNASSFNDHLGNGDANINVQENMESVEVVEQILMPENNVK